MLPDDSGAHPACTLALRGNFAPRHLSPEPVKLVPVWASPPDTRLLVMLGDPPAGAAAALRIIRHRLEQKRQQGMFIVGVTSARDGDGKTVLAAQLALVLSEAQRARVLLVEASFHRPALARVLGFSVPSGLGFSVQLANRIRGATAPWSVLALGPALHVLAENEAESGFPAVLHSPHFRATIERLGTGYDWVLIDAPSVLGTGDANVVEQAVDGMILVSRSGGSKGSELRAAVDQLGVRKAVGVVLRDAARAG